jgi:hypothetical protein
MPAYAVPRLTVHSCHSLPLPSLPVRCLPALCTPPRCSPADALRCAANLSSALLSCHCSPTPSTAMPRAAAFPLRCFPSPRAPLRCIATPCVPAFPLRCSPVQRGALPSIAFLPLLCLPLPCCAATALHSCHRFAVPPNSLQCSPMLSCPSTAVRRGAPPSYATQRLPRRSCLCSPRAALLCLLCFPATALPPLLRCGFVLLLNPFHRVIYF